MIKNKFSLFLLFVLLFYDKVISAQPAELRFKHYTTTDGLSQGDVYHMTQDSRGFMWFGTFDGLDRFDGYNFKNFKPYYNDSNSIEGGRINSIIEDKEGMIWVGTNEALNRYNFKTDCFEHFYAQDSLHQKIQLGYDPFFIDDKNELWFTYNKYKDLGSMNLISGKITTYPFANGKLEESITVGYPEKKFYRPISKIYSVGVDGLHIIDVYNKQTQYSFSSNSKNQSGKKTLIRQVLEDKNHVLWLAAKNGLISFNPVTKSTQLYNKYDEIKKITALLCLAQDKNDNIWCGSYGMGLNIFNKTTKKFSRNYIKYSGDPESIGQNTLTSLFIDRDSDILVGIDPDGIDKINPTYEQLNHVKINPEKKNADYTSSIWSIAEIDTNNLLICSNHQDLIIYDKIRGESRKFDLPTGLKESANNNTAVDSRKRILIASEEGIFFSDDKLKTIKIMLKKEFGFFNVYFFEFNKRILIGASNGLFSLPMNKKTNDADTIHLFDGKAINCINKSPTGLLCITTWDKELFLINNDSSKAVIVKKITFDFQIKSIFFSG